MKISSTLLAFVSLVVTATLAQAADRPSLGYVLQADRLTSSRNASVKALMESGRDWIVIDSAYDGTPEGRWSKSEISRMRSGQPGRRVIAYISIGEAETYRSYWQQKWDANDDGQPDAGAPKFLLGENPDWEGNYRVRYWSPDWQQLVLDEIAVLVGQGFDGIYLDIVDAFEGFEFDGNDWIDDRINPETQNSYRDDMVAWIDRLAKFARTQANSDFAIVPQNGPQLLSKPKYRKIISAVGIEDLFTDGNSKQDKSDSQYRLSFLKKAVADDIPVFVIEYCKKSKLRKLASSQAEKNDLSLLITDRDLTTLGTVAPKRGQ